jgi:hypothetical protein
MSIDSSKSKSSRSVIGIFGVLLLLFGILSLAFQYSATTTVNNNNAYAQEVDLGPFVTIGPPNRSDSLDAFSDGQNIHMAYKARGENTIYYGIVESLAGKRGEKLQDTPNDIIHDVTVAPSIHVAGGMTFVAAGDQFVSCDADDDDNCVAQQDFANPPLVNIEGEGNPSSCSDELDNDGDELTDAQDPDCFSNVSEFSTGLCSDGDDNDDDGLIDYGVPDVAGPDPDCFIPHENDQPSSCNDGVDNDGDELTDFDDPDCQIGVDSADSAAAAPQGGGNDTTDVENDTTDVEPTSFNPQSSVPQLTFVQMTTDVTTDECQDASTSDVTASDDANHVYFAWEDAGNICFKARHGGEFSENVILATNGADFSNPIIGTSSDGQFVHVIWQSNNNEIFYSRIVCDLSTPGEETCTPEAALNLSNTPSGVSNNHELAIEGSNVYVAWLDTATGGGDPYFRASKNNGDTFGPTKNLYPAAHPTGPPDVAADGNKVIVCFDDKSGTSTKHRDIFCIQSTNNGDSFGKRINVSKTRLGDSRDAQVDFTPDGEIYVAWTDTTPWAETGINIPDGKRIVLASESDNGIAYSAPVNLSDAANNPDPNKDASQLEVVHDVVAWDPTSRRG